MIVVSFLIILIFTFALIFLLANQGQFVDIHLFGISTIPDVDLWVVMLVPLLIGAVLTWMFMSFWVLQHRGEVRKLRNRNRQLLSELENLRNIALDEIPEGEPPTLPVPASLQENPN